jgi:hypothetical protein
VPRKAGFQPRRLQVVEQSDADTNGFLSHTVRIPNGYASLPGRSLDPHIEGGPHER